MSTASYTRAERFRGRRVFVAFSVFNIVAAQLLTGHIITLLLLRLNASPTVVGLVSSLMYISLIVTVFGRRVARAIGVVRTYTLAWLARNLCALLLPVGVVLAWNGRQVQALTFVVIGSILFFVFRGVGIVADTRVIGAVSEGPDRGAFLSRLYALSHAVFMGLGVGMALVLGNSSPFPAYLAFVSVGVAAGLVSVAVMSRLPEPAGNDRPIRSLAAVMRTDFGDAGFRRLLVLAAAGSFIIGGLRPFLLVHAKQVYGVGDGTGLVLTVIGSLGAVVSGAFSARFMDRLGAKPIVLVFVFLTLPALAASLFSFAESYLIPTSAVFFLANFAAAGLEVAMLTYFYVATPASAQIDRGIVFYVASGIGGSLGPLAAGGLLDLSLRLGVSSATDRFRFVFVMMGVVAGLAAAIGASLPRLGARSFGSVVASLLSPSDLRAIALTRKLERSGSEKEERRLLQQLAMLRSAEALDTILGRLDSPSFAVRREALLALESLPSHDSGTAAALDHEIRHHEYTTAHIAARVAGDLKVKACIGALRYQAANASDPHLVAESILALAVLEDSDSMPLIRRALSVTGNPLVFMYCSEAFRLLGDVASIPHMLAWLESHEIPVFVRDQAILSLAGLVGMDDGFFKAYALFVSDPTEALERLHDRFASLEDEDARNLARFCAAYVASGAIDVYGIGSAMEPIVARLPEDDTGLVARGTAQGIVSSLVGATLSKLPRFEFFLLAFGLHCLEAGIPRKDSAR